MANIPGASNVLPSVITDIRTQTKGVSVPGGTRIAAIIGEGQRNQIVVAAASGGGKDGFNPTYTSSTGSDGRHFTLTNIPLVSNRTTLFKNGLPLVGLEQAVSSTPFSNLYDYRVDPLTGQIELQTGHLVDQGGSFYTSNSTNVGLGSIGNLVLSDTNAPTETWTIKCISVQRSAINVPIQVTAKFIAFGSVSGVKLDSSGSPIIWVSNGQVITNGTLTFSISETQIASVSTSPFVEGDTFTIKVSSGVLLKNDTLTATYISTLDLNDPTFFTSTNDITAKHGVVTTANTLALGAQLAFANQTPGVLALQAAPAVPRRTSYKLSPAVNATSTNKDDFIFPLPPGVLPDLNSSIHFFIQNTATGVEKQVLPNKVAFYTLDTGGSNPTSSTFVFDNTAFPAGNSFSYSVNSASATINTGIDGYVNENATLAGTASFSSASVNFDSSYVGKSVKIIDSINAQNIGSFSITAVTGGVATITSTATPIFPAFTTGTSVNFHLINPATGATVALTTATDGVLTGTIGTPNATLSSVATSLTAIPSITTLRVVITVGVNTGTYRISSYNAGTNTLSITKAFVTETGTRFEVIDTGTTTAYVVVNQNVVPNGNGLRVTIVDARDASFYDAGWVTALASLELAECDIVVALPTQTISVIFQNALQHCKSMSSIKNKKERILFAGAIQGLNPENLNGSKNVAVENIGILEGIQPSSVADILMGNIEDLANYSVINAFGTTYRCVYFYPDQIVVQIGSDNIKVDGFYIAAAAAGFLAGTSNIAIPLTNKVLSGFTILKTKQYSQPVLEDLVANGVTVLQPVVGGGRVVWGKTTTQSGFPEEQEISVVFIRDRIAKTFRAGFAGFVGNPEDDTLSASLGTRALGLLNSFISQGLISAFADLSIARDIVDPRQWNISVRVQPNYPVNWIFIKVGVGVL